MKKILIALGLLIWWTIPAAAQCSGEAPVGYFCGTGAAQGFMGPFNLFGSNNTWTSTQTMTATQATWILTSTTAGNSSFVGLTGAAVTGGTRFGQEPNSTGGTLVSGSAATDGVFNNTASAGKLVFGTNNVGIVFMYPSGCVFVGTSPGDCGANNLDVVGLVEVPEVLGGSATGSQLTLKSTSSGSPSGDQVNLEATSVFVLPASGSGAGTLILGSGSGNPTIVGNGQAGPTFTIESTNNGTPSGDSLILKGSTITLRAFSGTSTIDIGVANATAGVLVIAGGSSGSTTLQASSAASGTLTLPAATDTIAVLGTAQSFSAVETFTGQTIYNMANTIASATSATLDDLKVSAATTTITGNTGSPITALSKVHILQPTFTDSSSVTVTTAATLTIDNAPAQAGSVTITNAYALNVAAGSSLFGGKVFMSGLTAGSGTKAMCINATANEVQTDTSATICGISALRYKNLISEITPDQGLGVLSLRSEKYRYKPEADQDDKIHVSLIADDMADMNKDCANYSSHGVENYMDRCFEAYQVAYDKKLWEIIGKLTDKLPAGDELREEVKRIPVH